jgi:bacterioferritin-associated ferredoxin
MMVCLCEGVSERKIRRSIDHGAATITDVTAACRAGGSCGGCHATIADLLVQAQQAHPVRLSVA